jgi:O-antigen/teichoic acid export membrane protein
MSTSSPIQAPHLAVRRNALWNILGLGLPMMVAVLFIPRLIAGMGTDRFGVLTLILVFLNYFGLFDLGIGRALTQLLAGSDRKDKRAEAALIWTVSALLGLLGALAALILFVAAPVVTVNLLRIRGDLAAETIVSIRELALVIPFLLHGLALKGILEANRRFDLSNIVRVPVVLFTFGAPFAVLPFSTDLRVIVPVVLSGRILAWLLNLVMVLRILPHLWRMRAWASSQIRVVVRMGGWFTVSGAIAPVMESLDRIFISSFLGISMVAYYTTPFELITKLGIISGGIGGVIFPEFAFRYRQNKAEARTLFLRGVKYILAILFPFALIATAYAHEGLAWWLDPHFADLSAPVLRWLSLYVFMVGAALVPYLFLSGIGRPGISARLHLMELPLHAILLYFLIHAYGIRGAAIGCLIRITFDFLGTLFFSGRLLGFDARTYARLFVPLAAAAAVLLAFHFPLPPLVKAPLVAFVLGLYAFAGWKVVLEPGDRNTIIRMLGPLRMWNHAATGR